MGGIGFVSSGETVTCCYVSSEHKQCRSADFELPKLTHEQIQELLQKKLWPQQFEPLDTFISSCPDVTGVTIATDSYFILDSQATQTLGLTVFLGISGRAIPVFAAIEQKAAVLLPPAMDHLGIAVEFPHGPANLPRPLYVYDAVLTQLCSLLLKGQNASAARAATAALIADRSSLYYFVSSQGTPQSAQDIIVHVDMRRQLFSKMAPELNLNNVAYMNSVVAATETTTLEGHGDLAGRDPRTIAIDYAMSQSAFKGAGEPLAIKFAVLSVCEKWGIRLYCSSLMDERFLAEVRDGLATAEKLDDRPRLILEILKSEEAQKLGLVSRFKQTLRFLSEKNIDISNLALELISGARVNSHRPEHLVLDGTIQQFDWILKNSS